MSESSDKSSAMALVAAGRAFESFTFVPDDGGDEINFNITALRHGIASGAIKAVKVQAKMDQIAPFIRQNRIWCPFRVEELDTESVLHDLPIALVEVDARGETTHTLVDGAHRILRLEMTGLEWLTFLEVDWNDAPLVQAGARQHPDGDWGAPLSSLLPNRKAR